MAMFVNRTVSCSVMTNKLLLASFWRNFGPSSRVLSSAVSHVRLPVGHHETRSSINLIGYSVYKGKPDFDKILRETPMCVLSVRSYAKGKDKGGKNKKKVGGKGAKKPKVELSEDELASVVDFEGFKCELEQALSDLKLQYQQQLSLRTNVGTFDSLVVETEDGNIPLIRIGRVVMKNPTLAVINMTANPRYTSAVAKAIENSGMNLNPQQDGTSIFVPIPKVTREHREKLAKNAKMLSDKTKDKLKVIQNNCIRAIKKVQDSHSADLIHNVQDTVQLVAHEFMQQADSLMQQKKDELLS